MIVSLVTIILEWLKLSQLLEIRQWCCVVKWYRRPIISQRPRLLVLRVSRIQSPASVVEIGSRHMRKDLMALPCVDCAGKGSQQQAICRFVRWSSGSGDNLFRTLLFEQRSDFWQTFCTLLFYVFLETWIWFRWLEYTAIACAWTGRLRRALIALRKCLSDKLLIGGLFVTKIVLVILQKVWDFCCELKVAGHSFLSKRRGWQTTPHEQILAYWQSRWCNSGCGTWR